MASVKAYDESGKLWSLTDRDYVATGGEGSVWRKGNLGFKVYTERDRMAKLGLDAKIKLLSAIQHPFIVAPASLLFDEKRRAIGFLMPWCDGTPLPRLFTTDGRARAGFTREDGIALARNMQEAVAAAHRHGALIVDGNELNYLAIGREPRLIDVDSWQIGRFPATAIMASVRDPKATSFSELSDWYAWGIVTFQLLTGIHPYKGRHPRYKPADWTQRMADHISVLNPEVSVPASVRSWQDIPRGLLDWYENMFEKGQRSAPSMNWEVAVPLPQAAKTARTVVQPGGTTVEMERIADLPWEPDDVWGFGIARREDRWHDWRAHESWTLPWQPGQKVEAWLDEAGALWMAVHGGDRLTLYRRAEGAVSQAANLRALGFFVDSGRLYLLDEAAIREIRMVKLKEWRTAVASSWPTFPRAIRLWRSFATLTVEGAAYLVLPLEAGCCSVRVRELDGLLIVNGVKAGSWVVLVAQSKTGELKRVELEVRGPLDYQYRNCDADTLDLNVVQSATGVNVSLPEDGRLVLARGHKERTLQEVSLTTGMRLLGLQGKVGLLSGRQIWSLSVKN